MKKVLIGILAAVLLAAVLFVPVPSPMYKDGGTRAFTALTYKRVHWNRITGDEVYAEHKTYWFPENFKSIDSLWAEEEPNLVHRFRATVLDIQESYVLVKPALGEWELQSSDRIALDGNALGNIGAQVGSVVEVYYRSGIMETYPAQIDAVKWELLSDFRDTAYQDQWLEEARAEDFPMGFTDFIITEIYSDCFFAVPVIPTPYTVKFNGTLSGEWCVGDQVLCTYQNTRKVDQRLESEILTVEPSTFVPDPMVAYKPVIYLYPETETRVSVALDLKGQLTCTYPAYNGGWQVTARPDGTLTDERGMEYNYLYWEGETQAQWDLETGFCVPGKDTAAFLEEALAKLGLNRREANEFIVYWLPLMEGNPYNTIHFQFDTYTDAAALRVTPQPDTVIRVFMVWQASDEAVPLPPQTLTAPERTGFTLVEWGGTQLP